MSCYDDNRYNMTMNQGSTFGFIVTVNDANGNTKNLVNSSASMQIRSSYDAPTPTETLSTANGEITIDGANGNVIVSLSATRTANIYVDVSGSGNPPKTKYVYDLELTDYANNVSKLLYGDLVVYAEVTR